MKSSISASISSSLIALAAWSTSIIMARWKCATGWLPRLCGHHSRLIGGRRVWGSGSQAVSDRGLFFLRQLCRRSCRSKTVSLMAQEGWIPDLRRGPLGRHGCVPDEDDGGDEVARLGPSAAAFSRRRVGSGFVRGADLRRFYVFWSRRWTRSDTWATIGRRRRL